MADAIVVRRNEQIKASAGQLYNLGAALVAASVVKAVSDNSVSWTMAFWFVGALGLISAGHGLLGMLEDDEQ